MRDWAWILRRAMPFIDALLIIVAFRFAHVLRYDWQMLKAVDEGSGYAQFVNFLPYALVYAFWLVGTWPVAGLYRDKGSRSWFEEVDTLLNGATNATVLVMALSFLLRPEGFSRLLLIEATVLVIILLSIMRLVYRMVRQVLRERGIGVERVLVVGAGDGGRAVLSAIIARPDLGYTPVGYLDDRP